MPHHLVNSRVCKHLVILDIVDSTNNYAMGQAHAGLASHGHVYFARDQFAGKGQRGKTWISNPGENIALSIVIQPDYPGDTFLLSASVALAAADFLSDLLLSDVSIKWPNDLYWRDRKAGGILIENIFQGKDWKFAIVGIGINANQVEFPEGFKAVSIKQVTGQHFDALELAARLCEKIEFRYQKLLEGAALEGVILEYNERLFKKGEKIKLRKENVVFETTIVGVSNTGQLITKDILERVFNFGEVEWV